MQFFSAAIILTLVAAAQAVVHVVQVGNSQGQTIYNPNNIQARKGDFIAFKFEQKNHTATQSSFDQPCTPLINGFNSGFNPVPANQTDNFPMFVVPVTSSTTPIWVHCEQGANTNGSHCGMGMVFAANANAQKSFDAFQQKALAIGQTLGVKPPASAPAAMAASWQASSYKPYQPSPTW